MDATDVGDGGCPANRRHRATIEIVERATRLAVDASPDVIGGSLAFLNCDWCKAWQWFAVALRERRKIARHQHLRMTWHAQVGLNGNTSTAVELDAKLSAQS